MKMISLQTINDQLAQLASEICSEIPNLTEFFFNFFRFKQYLEPRKPYDVSKQFLYVTLWRLIFVIVFQYFVFLVKDILSRSVNDIPSSLQAKLARKMHVARMCFRKSAVEAMRESSQRKRVSRTTRPAQFDGKSFYVEETPSNKLNGQRKHSSMFPRAVFHHQSYV